MFILIGNTIKSYICSNNSTFSLKVEVSEPLALPEDPQVETEDVVEDSKVYDFEDFC